MYSRIKQKVKEILKKNLKSKYLSAAQNSTTLTEMAAILGVVGPATVINRLFSLDIREPVRKILQKNLQIKKLH